MVKGTLCSEDQTIYFYFEEVYEKFPQFFPAHKD